MINSIQVEYLANKEKFVDWFKVAIIVAANLILALALMYWSGREGREFRKKLKESR